MVLLNDRTEKAFSGVIVCMTVQKDADDVLKKNNNYGIRKEKQNKELQMLLL